MQQVSPVHSVPETNLTSSLSLNQLEYALHLLLSPVTIQQVSPVRLAFERIHSLLDFAHTVVKPAFFEVLHLQDLSLQCSPLSRNRNASVTIFCRRIFHKSFLYLIRISLKIPFKLNSSGLEVFRLDRCGLDVFELNRLGLITCKQWDMC